MGMTVKCERCGVEFVRPKGKGKIPKHCPMCALELARAARRAYKTRII